MSSYFVGRARYPIGYPLKCIFAYFAVAAVLYVLGMYVLVTPYHWANWAIRAVILASYVLTVMRFEKIRLPLRRRHKTA